MKFFTFIGFSLLTTFLISCEKETIDTSENEIINNTETTPSELALTNSRITHLKKLGFTLTIWNRNNEQHTIDIKSKDILAFGTEKDRFVSHILTTKNKLSKNFRKSGLLKYVLKTRNKLEVDTKFYSCYIPNRSKPLKKFFSKRIKKCQKIHFTEKIHEKYAHSEITINFKLK